MELKVKLINPPFKKYGCKDIHSLALFIEGWSGEGFIFETTEKYFLVINNKSGIEPESAGLIVDNCK